MACNVSIIIGKSLSHTERLVVEDQVEVADQKTAVLSISGLSDFGKRSVKWSRIYIWHNAIFGFVCAWESGDRYHEINQSETSSEIAPVPDVCKPAAEIVRIAEPFDWPLESSNIVKDAEIDNDAVFRWTSV